MRWIAKRGKALRRILLDPSISILECFGVAVPKDEIEQFCKKGSHTSILRFTAQSNHTKGSRACKLATNAP